MRFYMILVTLNIQLPGTGGLLKVNTSSSLGMEVEKNRFRTLF